MKDERKEVIRIKDEKLFKVYCEFYIHAKDETQAEEIVIDDMCDNNFFEEHIIIEEVSDLPKGQGIFNDTQEKSRGV